MQSEPAIIPVLGCGTYRFGYQLVLVCTGVYWWVPVGTGGYRWVPILLDEALVLSVGVYAAQGGRHLTVDLDHLIVKQAGHVEVLLQNLLPEEQQEKQTQVYYISSVYILGRRLTMQG